MTVDSNGSALRLRLKLDSVVNNDDDALFAVNDVSNELLLLLLLILLLGNFTVESNDELVGVLNRLDGFNEVFRRLDDVVVVADVERLDGLLELSPVNNELDVFNDDRRLELVNKELVFNEVLGFVDKSEFVVDNNEDAVDGFFGSAICLIAQYCIIRVEIISKKSRRQK